MARALAMAAGVCLAAAAAPVAQTNQTVLRYRELPFVVDTWPVQALPESAGAPFTKLPEPGRGGLILASLDILGKPLGMAWNRKAGRVWLDLNGNRDFSDDPEGVFQTPERGPAQTFTNTHLTAVTRRGPVRVCLDLVLVAKGRSNCVAVARSRCCLLGKLEVAGGAWQVAYGTPFLNFESPVKTGLLMARPWNEAVHGVSWPATMPAGMADFSLVAPNPDAVEWNQVSGKLFDGNTWSLEGRETETNGPPAMVLQVRSEVRETGVIAFGGSNVTRVLLVRSGKRALEPVVNNRVRVAEGFCNVQEVIIGSGAEEVVVTPNAAFQVVKGGTNWVAAGMPLVHKITATRQGESLVLDYKLTDTAGRACRTSSSMTGAKAAAPRFVIWQGKRRIAAGSFEYG